MKNLVVRFANDESGATAIEYALIAAGIGVGISAAVYVLGTDLSTFFGKISTKVGTATVG